MTFILNDFKCEVVNQQILTNQHLSEDINGFTKIYQSPDNRLIRVNDKELLVKNTLKVSKEDINLEKRRIRKVTNPKNGANAANFSTLLDYSKDFMQFSERLDIFENVIINILATYLKRVLQQSLLWNSIYENNSLINGRLLL